MENISFQDSTLLNNVFSQFTDLDGVGEYGTTSHYEKYERLMLQPLIYKVVAMLPTDATRFDMSLEVNKVINPELMLMLDNVEVYSPGLDSMGWVDCLREALILSRLYGDGFIILGYSDTDDLSRPLSNKGNLTLNWMTPRYRRDLSIDINSKQFHLTINPSEAKIKGNDSFIRIHPSRVCRFKGRELFGSHLSRNHHFNASILEGTACSYQRYISSVKALSTMVNSHSSFSYGINDLSEMVKMGKVDLIKKRFETILHSLRKIGGIAYDKKNEEVSYLSRNYSNLDKVIEILKDDLLAASGLPGYKLWGKSEGGNLSTGAEAEAADYKEIVTSYQNGIIDNPLCRVLKPCLPLGASLKIHFESSVQEEEAAATKTNSSNTLPNKNQSASIDSSTKSKENPDVKSIEKPN